MKSNFKILSIAVFTAFASIFIYDRFFNEAVIVSAQQDYSKSIISTAYSYNAAASAINSDFTMAVNKTLNAVVHVKNKAAVQQRRSNSIWDQFFYDDRPERYRIGTGSGVIVSPDGYIITNSHVIEDFSEIEVTTNDNKTYKAELVGNDSNTDIAVLKIDANANFPYVTFGDSDATRVGEWALAVGNPFNLNSTVTAGIISAKSRDLNSTNENESYIQTDAAVNMGNSGGALVNTRGELIGINSAISSFTGGYVGYSFAVPSNVARKVYQDIVEYGDVQRVLLGVNGTALNSARANDLDTEETEGFYINTVEEGLGAEKAGLQEGDIIKEVDHVKINKFADLSGYLATKHPGETVRVIYMRERELKNVDVHLKRSNSAIFMNMRLKNLSEKEKKEYGIEHGLAIDQMANNRLYNYGVNEDFILLDINREKIKDISSLKRYGSDDIDSILLLSPEGERVRIPIRYY